MAYVGVLELEFRIEGSHSLKEKQAVVHSLVDRLRSRFNVSVAETDHQDIWNLTQISLAVVSGDRLVVERLLTELIDFAEAHADAELVGVHQEIF